MRLAAVAVDIFVSVAAESNRFNISDANLFFNRVASTVWIGRPLLVLLGLVVVLVLSMSCVMYGLIPLVFQRRSYVLDVKLWDMLPNDQRVQQRLRLSVLQCMSNWFAKPPLARFTRVSMRYGSDPTSHLEAPPYLASRLHVEVLNGTLPKAIQGLHCWVDFGQRWEMAHTEARQLRCHMHDVTNGAVYIESMLRNTDWSSCASCWGTAFDAPYRNELHKSVSGLAWLATVQSEAWLTVPDEARYWTDVGGISQYTVHTYAIENALWCRYTMRLSHSNGSFRFRDQTTFKMSWGVANDLLQVTPNATTSVAGRSLIRSSHVIDFANISFRGMLIQADAIAIPLHESFWLAESTIGPFGSTDLQCTVLCVL
ncbi:hypothetical protein B5M09_005792 [Aphanomyces astaci]|uniref:Uncharacterized protein n=1 Tax=Aphanomyces astaci TaxID=112090 RepID=A0A3R7Y5B1_APHAT|nr:hypothetical protein B5M09_005792 [Aphanomyces astaci]